MTTHHPLSIISTAARTRDSDHRSGQAPVKPMSGSRRRAIYKRQRGGIETMTPAQTRRYAAKVARNGYIPA